jgi:hypothetical protein
MTGRRRHAIACSNTPAYPNSPTAPGVQEHDALGLADHALADRADHPGHRRAGIDRRAVRTRLPGDFRAPRGLCKKLVIPHPRGGPRDHPPGQARRRWLTRGTGRSVVRGCRKQDDRSRRRSRWRVRRPSPRQAERRWKCACRSWPAAYAVGSRAVPLRWQIGRRKPSGKRLGNGQRRVGCPTASRRRGGTGPGNTADRWSTADRPASGRWRTGAGPAPARPADAPPPSGLASAASLRPGSG